VTGIPEGCAKAGSPTAASGTSADYRAMWKNVRARFDAAGVTNVVWVMNYMGYEPFRCMTNGLWPGNDLVDWVAFDIYGTATRPNFTANVGSMYDFLNATSDATHNYASKPYSLAEWGIYQNGLTQQQTYDYSDMAKTAVETNRFPNLKMYMIFDNLAGDGLENRVGYFYETEDPVRQQHYTAFAQSSAFVDPVLPPIDTDAPTVSLTAPSAADTVQGTITVTATAADDTNLKSAQLLVDGTAVGEAQTLTGPQGDVDISLNTTTLPNGRHTLSVRVSDVAGRQTTSDTVAVTVANPVADTQAPTVPTLTGDLVGQTVELNWTASTDDTGVAGYDLYRNDSLLIQTDTTSYVDTAPAQGSSYRYALVARDAAGNRSAASSAVTIASADTTAPTAPANLAASLNSNTVHLTWQAASDNVGVTGYRVLRDGVLETTLSATAVSYSDSAATQATSHTYSVQAVDAAGNSGTEATVAVYVPDTAAPSSPSGLSATVSNGTVNLSWQAAADNIGVTGYRVLRGSVLIATTTTTTYSDVSAPQGASHEFSVQAVDAAGNVGAASKITATVADTTAPTATGKPTITFNGTQVIVAWTAGSDNVGVKSYTVLRDGVVIGSTTTLSYTDTTVVQGRTYAYTVKAVDAAGNQSVSSATTSATAPDTIAPATVAKPTATLSGNSIIVAWAATTDNVAVVRYEIWRGGTYLATTTARTYTDTTVKQGSTYTYTVRAVDAANNKGAQSVATTSLTVRDTTAPMTPTGLTATSSKTRTVQLNWNASTDNVAVTGYRIYRGTTLIATVSASTLSYTVTGLSSNTTYGFTVRAIDAAGNVSASSTQASVRVR
jgi:fibronectin type 3 domain-containing protein